MKKTLKLVALLMALCMVLTLGLTACTKDCGVGNHTDEDHDGKCDVCKKAAAFKHVDANGDKKCDTCGADIVYTYNDYLSVTPSNWNELDYSDSNDTAILSYIVSPFFEYDYEFEGGKKFNADGSINFDGIVEGGFTVKYSAATKIEDVTAQYADAWNIASWATDAAPVSDGGYAWKITLRQDLKWDDGTPIKAKDFVYTMEQQLDFKFNLTRADTYYTNAVKIHNAKNFFYTGQKGWFNANLPYDKFDDSIADKLIFKLGPVEDGDEITATSYFFDWLKSYLAKYYGIQIEDLEDAAYFTVALLGLYDFEADKEATDEENEAAEEEAIEAAMEQLLALEGHTWAEIQEDDDMREMWELLLGEWQTDPGEELNFFVTYYEYADITFDKVGIFAPSDYELVLVLDSPQQYIKEDGSLSYLVAYNFGSLPLVKESLYEQCKKEPQSGSTLWTQNYNTSLETTASWGPYKLTYFQAGRQFILEKNPNWYGWNIADLAGQYQADRLVTDVIAQTEAAQLAFWAGQVDGLGIDVTIADDYRNSDYAVYTPGSGTFGIQLYGNLPVLLNSGRNNGILAIEKFRGALSLALDRNDYNATVYTSHRTCLGVMGPSYYYDVENGLTYRGSDEAKAGLLRVYGFELNSAGKWTDGVTVYNDIDDAYDAMTGYNLTKAKQWLEEAYKELTDNAEKYGYDASKKITIKMGTSTDNSSTRRQYNYFVNWIANLTAGTSLEGKIELTFDASFGDDWSDAFMDGEYEFAPGTGFSGAAFDPFYMIGSNLNIGSLSYHTYWDTKTEKLKITLPAGDYPGAGGERELTIVDWYNSLNGNMTENPTYNLGPTSGTPASVRLIILAALEEYALSNYYFIATTSQYSASLHSAKWSYASDTYNVMMGFGGLQYMQFNYADDEWKAFVAERGGDLSNFYKG